MWCFYGKEMFTNNKKQRFTQIYDPLKVTKVDRKNNYPAIAFHDELKSLFHSLVGAFPYKEHFAFPLAPKFNSSRVSLNCVSFLEYKSC